MSKKTILIIDDEPDTLTFFSNLLEDNGFETMTAENGAEAVKQLEAKRPDLVTLDITMPEMSGTKFYRTLRENKETADIPIIIITGISDDFKKFISTRRHVPPPDGYLSKPVEADDMINLVNKILN